MSVDSVVPINEAFNVDDVTRLNGSKRVVNCSSGSGEISFNTEAVVNTILGNGNIDIVSCTGSIIFVRYALNGKTIENCELILVIYQIFCTELCGKILSGSNVLVRTFNKRERCINYLDLSGPFSFIA